MTQVERLVRNLCEERRLQILSGEREAIRQLPEQKAWKDLPTPIRAAVTEIRRLEQRQKKLTAKITAAGFQSYHVYVGKPLSLLRYNERQAEVRTRFEARRAVIQQLRTDATIATLGKSAVEARVALVQLQQKLAKV